MNGLSNLEYGTEVKAINFDLQKAFILLCTHCLLIGGAKQNCGWKRAVTHACS